MDAFSRRRERRAQSNSVKNDIEMGATGTPTQKQTTETSDDSSPDAVNHNGHKVTKHIQPEGESGRRGFSPLKFLKICFRSASPASAMVNVLWPVVPGV